MSIFYTKYGECRFCSERGQHQDITKEYYHDNTREVYVDVFIECFNLFLSTHTDLSTLICRSCVTHLREAVSFREMVVGAEKKLIDILNDAHDGDTEFINVPNRMDDLKIEPKLETDNFDNTHLDMGLDYDTESDLLTVTPQRNQRCAVPKCKNLVTSQESKAFFCVPSERVTRGRWSKAVRRRLGDGVLYVCEDHFNIENDTQNYLDHKLDGATPTLKPGVVPHIFKGTNRRGWNQVESENRVNEDISTAPLEDRLGFRIEGEAEFVARFPSLPKLPTLRSLRYICPEYNRHLGKLRGKNITARKIETQLHTNETKNQRKCFVSEKVALATNACALLENSNATTFKTKMRAGYPCFYCRQIFLNLESLQRHQLIHPKSTLFKLLTKYTADELVIYADVTDLKCTICNSNVLNLNEFKKHLLKKHSIKMYTEYTDRVVPFKLTDKDFVCQVCGFTFETFGSVEKHMSTHYRNYICVECGSGFVTRHRLKIHVSLVHRNAIKVCDLCKKVFNSQLKLKIHYDVVHRKVLLNKCPMCSERFIDYFTRQKHLVDAHGQKPILYKCRVCDKAFNRRYMLSCHVKRSHLEQKDFQCDQCPYMCFSKGELREHMLKHSGTKSFECAVCKKTFARKKSLDVHLRVHSNDRRFSCEFCGQSFVHKCSLKGHIRSHHDEVGSLE